MKRIDVQFLDQGLHRVLFNALPVPAFVVDEDVTILEYNAAAARVLGPRKRALLRRRSGDVLHCMNALKTPQGCGHSAACADCLVRNSVRTAARGKQVTHLCAQMRLRRRGKPARLDLRLSCYPFDYKDQPLILLLLEGLK